MSKARKWFSVFTLVAFVITAMPTASFAQAHHHEGATAQKAAPSSHNCHHAEKTAAKKSCCDHAGKKSCCDKGMCKCATGSCNSGLAKIFNNGNSALPPAIEAQGQFRLSEENIDSALPERIQRPPRA
jgi:hypothetical protein